MNIREARKLKQGAIVREAWNPYTTVQGIVLSKQHVQEEHTAKLLCQKKKERYDVTVHWLGPERLIPRKEWGDNRHRVQVRENWEIMVVSHAE
jgi:hypothetical protein